MVTRKGLVEESVKEARDTKSRAVLIALAGLLALLLTSVAVLSYFVYNDYHSAAQRGTNLAAQVRAACADPTVDTAELGSLCEKAAKVVEEAPVPPTVAKGDKGDAGDAGATGPAGPPPSAAEVAQAVKVYCSTGVCRGVITSTQINQAVRQYCANHNACKGITGDKGETGATGATGEQGQPGVNGKDGTNGTDGQDAFPFSFSFTVEQGLGNTTTYDCVVQDPSTPATCTPQG